MALETTSTSLTELVNSEWIDPLILDYAIDATVIAPLCREANLAGKSTKVASFSVWVKDVGVDVTEGTAMSNNELETTDVQVTAAQVGVLRELTDLVLATNVLGPDALMNEVAADAGRLLAEMLEDDLAALFASASTSVGTSGVDLSVANFVEAIAKLNTNKARGQKVAVLDDQQSSDLQAAVAASGSTVFANSATGAQSILNANSDAFIGALFGVPIWMTNLTDTANAGADVVGAMLINGRTNPRNAPIGIASLWGPKMKQRTSPENTSEIMGFTMAYGVAEISDFNYVKIVTDA